MSQDLSGEMRFESLSITNLTVFFEFHLKIELENITREKRFLLKIPTTVTPHDLRRSYARNLFLAGIPTEVIRQNVGHADVKTTQDYIGVLDGSARAPVSVYDASLILEKIETTIPRN